MPRTIGDLPPAVAGAYPCRSRFVADRDLWAILAWLVDGVGGEWSSTALDTTGRIYRIPATEENP